MKSISKIFSKLLTVTFAASALALSSEDILSIPNEYGLNIQKLTGNKEELRIFEETGRLETHIQVLAYSLESPFGMYVVYEEGTPVAIQSFSPDDKHGVLIAEQVTDVLQSYQGKKYGSRLMAATVKFIAENYLGKFAAINQTTGKSLLPLTYLYSCNEWMWGENIESLKSALNAGYRIVCLGRTDTAQMLYTTNQEMLQKLWSKDRTDQLLTIASMVRNPETYIEEEFRKSLHDLMGSLDFTQETDIATFLNIHMKSTSQYNIQPWQQTVGQEVATFIQTLNENQRRNITRFSKGERIIDAQQNIPVDLVGHALGPYSNWLEAETHNE